VQAALKLIRDSKGKPFLAGSIDGVAGGGTNGAIYRFQTEVMKTIPMAPLNLGRVLPGSATEKALLDALPADARLAAIPDHKIVYRAATAAVLAKAEAALAQEAKFQPAFRQALSDLDKALYASDALVLTIAPKGGYRTFQEQNDLPSNVTGAGPGESNHNFGNGCDFGFFEFAYLTDQGTWLEESVWLSVKLQPLGLHKPFWKRRNDNFAGRNLYPSKLAGDFIHVQSFDDNAVSMTKSLADLMSRESPNCYWAHQGQYRANLIFSDTDKWPVGTAKQIWSGAATVSSAELAAALEQARTLRNAQPSGKLPEPLETTYLKFAAANRSPTKGWTAAEITAAQIKTMREFLREDMIAAEAAYLEWKAVP
jgi:hypothetical protein